MTRKKAWQILGIVLAVFLVVYIFELYDAKTQSASADYEYMKGLVGGGPTINLRERSDKAEEKLKSVQSFGRGFAVIYLGLAVYLLSTTK